MLGLPALGITDRNSLAGIVRAHQRAQEAGIRLIVGCRLDLTDGPRSWSIPPTVPPIPASADYFRSARGRAGKGACELDWDDLTAHGDGLIAILCSRPHRKTPAPASRFPDRAYVALTLHRRPNDAVRLQQIADLGRPGARSHRRDRRRAVSRAAAPHPAGRGDLHPRRLHHRRCRLPPRALRRPSSQIARGNGAAVRAAIRTPSPAPRKSSTGADSRWTKCATNIRTKCASPA